MGQPLGLIQDRKQIVQGGVGRLRMLAVDTDLGQLVGVRGSSIQAGLPPRSTVFGRLQMTKWGSKRVTFSSSLPSPAATTSARGRYILTALVMNSL